MNTNQRKVFLQNAGKKDLINYFKTLQRVANYDGRYRKILMNDVKYLKQHGGDNTDKDCDIKTGLGSSLGATGRKKDPEAVTSNGNRLPSILIITFNTEAKQYTTEGCTDFFESIFNENQNPDIIVICLQESRGFGDSILESFRKCYKGYCKIADESLQSVGKEGYRGLRTYVLMKSNYYYISDYSCKTNSIRTLSKGSICVTLIWEDLSLSFINSHLPFKKAEGKNQGLDARKEAFVNFYNDHQKNIENFKNSLKFFIGDLNFRNNNECNNNECNNNECNLIYVMDKIIGETSRGDPKEVLHNNVYKKCDQLYKLLNSKDIFYNQFTEGIRGENGKDGNGIDFKPTCKLKKGRPALTTELTESSKRYNTQPNKYVRIPSWCDRILYSSATENNFYIKCDKYDSIDQDLTFQSDHAPVYGMYNIQSKAQPKAYLTIDNNCEKVKIDIYKFMSKQSENKTEINFDPILNDLDKLLPNDLKQYKGKLKNCTAENVLLTTNTLLSEKKSVQIEPEIKEILYKLATYFNLKNAFIYNYNKNS